MAHSAASAPWPLPAAFITARQPFIDQFFAQTFAAARQDAEFAAIDIRVRPDAFEAERSGIDQRVQSLRGRRAQRRRLMSAARIMGFGRVDIGDADFDALIIERVAIDHAIGAAAFVAETERGDFTVAGGGRGEQLTHAACGLASTAAA